MEFNYKDEIKLNLLKRKSNNPSYSLRAYSRDLNVSLTALSSVLNGKRNLSIKNALTVAKNLCFSPLQIKLMIESINDKGVRQFLTDKEMIKEDEFNMIANWYSIALLTLIRNNKIKNQPAKLGKKFGVPKEDIKHAIDVLKRLGYVKVEKGYLIRLIQSIKTSTDIPSEALKKYHKSNLQIAIKSLMKVDLEKRYITSLSLSVDEKDIGKAKRLIEKFKKEFDEKIDNKKSENVYNFSMQFFPACDQES